jgi:Na+-translocating ferredoxin:NAD+ oxidoreductase RnfE subunit
MIQRFQDDDLLKGLLVFAPFYSAISSLYFGIKLALIAFSLILLLGVIMYASRKLFTLPLQHLAFTLIVSISLILIMRMLLEAEYYSIAQTIGLFFPLLLINSLVLSINSTIFSQSDFKLASAKVLKLCLAVTLFFAISGFLHEIFNSVSFLHSPAGFFFLSGILFAVINILNKKKLDKA